MVEWEAIYAVKSPKYSHHSGDQAVYFDDYHIQRRQFDAENEAEARDLARKKKENINDCRTTARMLSLSTTLGLSVPNYERF